MTSSSTLVYSRSDLLQLRSDVITAPSSKVRRRLWYLGILRVRNTQPHLIPKEEEKDLRPAQPKPQGPVTPSQLVHRNAHAPKNLSLSPRFRLATFNTRTLRLNWRVHELVRLASDQNISILGLQEHRRYNHDAPQLARGWDLRLSPASPEGVGGIGFLLSPTASKSLLDITFPSDRVGLATFALKERRLHVICVYAPTAPRTTQDPIETENFYDLIGSLLDSLPSRDLSFVIGDFNAPLTADGYLVKNKCGCLNYNSDYLSSFIHARSLVAANGLLRQRFEKLPTFHGPNNRSTRLDWILCPSTQRGRLRRILNIRPRCINSDHTFLICEADAHWPSFKRPSSKPLWTALKDPAKQASFLSRLHATALDMGESAAIFAAAVQTAAADLPTREMTQPRAIWDRDPAICHARRQVQSAIARHGNDSHEAVTSRAFLQRTYAARSEAYVNEAVQEIELATDTCRHSAAWRVIDQLTGRKSRPKATVAAKSIEHRKKLLEQHYQKVLNNHVPTDPLPPIPSFVSAAPQAFDTGPITEAEVNRALRTMRPDAATGTDGIPTRVLMLQDPTLLSSITRLLNTSCNPLSGDGSGPCPQWRTSKIVSIPKKGNSTSLDNQRGIALSCSLPKLMNTILRNRLLPNLNSLLLGLQSGFRPGRSSVEQIATIRCVIDLCRTQQNAASIVFIDFKKAFDSVSRPSIAWLLNYYGVPPPLVSAIMALYCDTRAFVHTAHGPTDKFSTSSGVLQGDTLSPLLFIVVMDYVLRRCLRDEDSFVLAPRRSPRHPAVLLSALAYADDVTLLCRDPSAAQHTLTRLCSEGRRVGLKVNAEKTEVLHIGFSNPPALSLPGGEEIQQCQDFRYLGSRLTSPDSIISDRRAQAWRASHLLRKFFHSAASDSTKVRLFRAAVEPIFLYGLEAVPLTPSRERTLDAHYRALLRNALGIHYPQKLSNRDLFTRARTPAVTITLRQRRQRLVGHCLRSHQRGNSIPLALALLRDFPGRLRRGHARTHTLRKTFAADLAVLGLNFTSASSLPSSLFSQRVRARTHL